jgi:hypothetical protein
MLIVLDTVSRFKIFFPVGKLSVGVRYLSFAGWSSAA